MIWNFFGTKVKVEKTPEEQDLPHTYKCACDVKWVAKGLETLPCWACGEPVKPECYHI